MYGHNPWPERNARNKAKKLEEERSNNYSKAKAEGRIAAQESVTSEIKDKLRTDILNEIKQGKHKDISELEAKIAYLEDSIKNCGTHHTFIKEPKGEFEVEMLFLQYAHHLGFYDMVRNNQFPDYFAKINGKKCTIELEEVSGNFIAHNHDPAKADYVICWRHNTDQIERLPVNVIELMSKLSAFYAPKC